MRFLTFLVVLLIVVACKNKQDSATNSLAEFMPPVDTTAAGKSAFVFNDTVLVSLAAPDFAAVLKVKPNMPIFDLRTPDRFAQGHIWRSTNLNYNDKDFMKRISGFGRNQEYAVYCETGEISYHVAEEMKRLGFYRIYHLQKGLMNWGESGVPLQLK